MKLSDYVAFRRDLLFNGAVQISWFESDPVRRDIAAEHFVFHGPAYHGVPEAEAVADVGHRLIDTASFTREFVDAVCGEDMESPFAIAIAGWGTGKSHLGLALAALLSAPDSNVSEHILSNLGIADDAIALKVRDALAEDARPFLVLALNGMADFNLPGEISRQVLTRLRDMELDAEPIEALRPRFSTARTFAERNFELREAEFAQRFGRVLSLETILARLSDHDEKTFAGVDEIFQEANGSPIGSVGQESLQQLVGTACRYYCGEGKPFRGLVIIFDEFGRYLEFAVQRPHVAGSAALQQLFEGVQENASHASLLCFIQYELKAYASRVAPELRSELNRFTGRYDSAEKFYLSTNLETLLASLIEKKDGESLDRLFEDGFPTADTEALCEDLTKRFPGMRQHMLWQTLGRFRRVVQKGCWPLHPAATWFLYRLAADGKCLQQRSAVTFVDDAMALLSSHEVDAGTGWTIPATCLCSEAMATELMAAEEYGQQGASAHNYATARHRFRHDLTPSQDHVLRAVLIASKIGVRATSRAEYHGALRLLSGLAKDEVAQAADVLLKEYGALEWDDRLKRFEIVGDAVPRRAFKEFLRSRSSRIDSDRRAELFALHGRNWCELEDVDPGFAAENDISTTEWRFKVTCSNARLLEQHVRDAVHDWYKAVAPDACRGQLIYCYLGSQSEPETTHDIAVSCLRRELASLATGEQGAPVLVVFLHDEEGKLGLSMAEHWTLTHGVGDDEASKFANFIMEAKAASLDEIRASFHELAKERRYCYAAADELRASRLSELMRSLFQSVYPQVMAFPFDGFNTTRGNAAKDCREITAALLNGMLTHEWIAAHSVRTRNRAVRLLNDTWQCLGADGTVSTVPRHLKARKIIAKLSEQLSEDGIVNLGATARLLCRPPYGCNLASAGLLLGVLIGPRLDNLAVFHNGEELSFPSWLQLVLKSCSLDFVVLDRSTLRHVSVSGGEKWIRLLDGWDMELTHIGRAQFMQQAKQLRQAVPLPKALYDRWRRLSEQAGDSCETLRKWRADIDKQEAFLATGYREHDVGKLSRTASELLQLRSRMQKRREEWTEDQFGQVDPLSDRARQAIVQYFDEWLPVQKIHGAPEIGRFRHRMIDWLCRTLEGLGLPELAERARRHTMQVIKHIEDLQHLKYILDEARAYVRSHEPRGTTGVSELRATLDTAQKLASDLRRAYASEESAQIHNALNEVLALQDRCKEVRSAHATRAKELWNRELHNVEDLRECTTEVRTLLGIFDGSDQDVADLRAMQGKLAAFERDYVQLADTALSAPELAALHVRLLAAFCDEHGDDGLPWDAEVTFRSFLATVESDRARAADAWLQANTPQEAHIASMDAEHAHNWRRRLDGRPAVLAEQQLARISDLAKQLDGRLDDLEVEGLLVRFQNLTSALQERFLEEARRLRPQASK